MTATPPPPARDDDADNGDAAHGAPGGFAPGRYPPLATLWRRLVALGIDWAAAVAISMGFFDFAAMATLGVFALMTFILVATLGASIGHVVCGLAVRRGPGQLPGVGRAFVRTVLLCLVIPAVVWGPDGRGLHDVVAGTTITRIR